MSVYFLPFGTKPNLFEVGRSRMPSDNIFSEKVHKTYAHIHLRTVETISTADVNLDGAFQLCIRRRGESRGNSKENALPPTLRMQIYRKPLIPPFRASPLRMYTKLVDRFMTSFNARLHLQQMITARSLSHNRKPYVHMHVGSDGLLRARQK